MDTLIHGTLTLKHSKSQLPLTLNTLFHEYPDPQTLKFPNLQTL